MFIVILQKAIVATIERVPGDSYGIKQYGELIERAIKLPFPPFIGLSVIDDKQDDIAEIIEQVVYDLDEKVFYARVDSLDAETKEGIKGCIADYLGGGWEKSEFEFRGLSMVKFLVGLDAKEEATC